jgi:hypothetical protein
MFQFSEIIKYLMVFPLKPISNLWSQVFCIPQFKVHKTILALAIPEVNWNSTPMPLTGLPEEVIQMMLYYAYSECLIKGLSEETARLGLKAAKGLRGFEKFSKLCETFLTNTALKQREFIYE